MERTGAGSLGEVLAPLSIIRTETVLSRFPVHNLAKKGKVNIQIIKRGESGDIRLKWEVSHSDRYGQPRQLAYKLDTLIVNRRLDEQARPLPVVVKIGSLREICRGMGVQESGKMCRDVAQAFLQNASAFINAQVAYRGADGIGRSLEAGFTRYGVVFTGEKLPDGRVADAVYVTLNQPYWEVVNTAPLRPLDYDYLKALTPAAQRFYEIVSFRVYATLKNDRSEARLAYSDYCAFSAQQRYFDVNRFRTQMYKVHKPHLASGYLESVAYELISDGEGKPDWMMIYAPGPKARAEFAAFAKRQLPGIERVAAQGHPPSDQILPPVAIEELISRGIAPSYAAKLLRKIQPGQQIVDQLEWADSIIAQAPQGAFRNPPGFYVWLLRDNIAVPAAFETTRRRKLREEARRTEAEHHLEYQQIESAYEEYTTAETEKALAALGAGELETAIAPKRHLYKRRFPHLPPATLEEIALQAVRAEIAAELALLPLEQFRELHSGHKGQD